MSALAMNISTKWAQIFGLSTLTLAISACQTVPMSDANPVVARPNIPLLPGQNYELYGNNQVPSSLAAVRWQSFYTDPKLKALIQLGLDYNKDVKQTVLAIQRAQAQYRITDASDAPNVVLNGQYSYGATNIRDRNPNDSFNVGLGLAAYELDFWGKVSSLKDQALQNYLSTTAARDTAQVSLIANIARSYVDLSYQQKQLELAISTLKTREESLRITKARLDAGIDSKAPSLQAAASVETARIAALNAQSGVLKARNALKFLVGAPISDDMLPAPAVSSIASNQVLSAGLPSDLLRYRPDILQAEYNLKAAGANIEVARAAYYPSISLTGNLGYSSSDLSDLFKSNASSWSFGPSIRLPLFDAGQRDANYEVAQIERDQAVARYESAVETAFREVNDVLADRATLDQRTQAQYRLQENYQGLFDISDARFKAQVDDYLAVLDAQRSLFSTQQSILNLEQERLNNQIALYQALGGGANLGPVIVPTSKYYNLVNVLEAKSNKQIAAQAIEASTGPIILTPEQAYAIEANQPVNVVKQKELTPVDINNDNNTDAYISVVENSPNTAGSNASGSNVAGFKVIKTKEEVKVVKP
ncbi:efflux transporter outer membrane subunit [Psychrobacter sp.]|uniref:efflux transporter outer membrane subunit n=1 Tax=Psychrobacter sp. TaxID=56811 RepID=UPI0025CDAD4C|nr:efflux transporter outer membrane subunit [Psychrobacter sp.]